MDLKSGIEGFLSFATRREYLMRHLTMKRVPCSAAVLLLLFAASGVASAKNEPQLPESGLDGRTSMVFWLDLEAVTDQAVSDTFDAVGSTIPEGAEEGVLEDYESARSEADQYLALRDALVEAGAKALLIGVRSQSAQVSEDGGEEDTDQQNQQSFLLVDPETDPERIQQAIVKSATQFESMEPESREQMLNVQVHRHDEQWLWLGPQRPVEPEHSHPEPELFVEALKTQDGAPARMAYLMTEADRQKLSEAMLEPGAFMLAGILQPLQSLESTTVGLWLGHNPECRVTLDFDTPASAEQFQAGLSGMVMLVSTLLGFAQDGEADASGELEQRQLKAVMALLILKQDATRLSKTIDIGVLEHLAEVGVIWDESADEDAEPAEPDANTTDDAAPNGVEP
ncbi:MAG: hypothetical protein GVY24_02290 [Planctomycetes bacterium]|jgi:hypothetical protein|nr:hypothetical protein [Planctomycetota bacterium]